MKAKLTREERETRSQLFGSIADSWRSIRPYWWELPTGRLLEIPVTTMPLFRIPFHLSYILYLSTYSSALARVYWRTALALCRVARVSPSVLLHPLDFLGGDDVAELSFFPAMHLQGDIKRDRVQQYLSDLAAEFEIVPLGDHARHLVEDTGLPVRQPDLAPGGVPNLIPRCPRQRTEYLP